MTTFTKARTAKELAAHVAALAAAFDIKVHAFAATVGDSAASCETRAIFVPPIDGTAAYAAALHELGHILHPGGRLPKPAAGNCAKLAVLRVVIEEEQNAWAWARANAIDWDVTCDALERHAYDTYANELREMEYDALLPRETIGKGDAARFFRTRGRFGAAPAATRKPVTNLKTQPKLPQADISDFLKAFMESMKVEGL